MRVIEFPAGTAPADIRVFAAGPAPAVAEAQAPEGGTADSGWRRP